MNHFELCALPGLGSELLRSTTTNLEKCIMEPVFSNWSEQTRGDWGNKPLRQLHRLHHDPLFSFETLASLIDAYPREHYALVEVGAAGSDRRLWREGDIGGLKGADVINAIRQGRMWLNLRNVGKLFPEYSELLQQIFAEISQEIPGYHTFNQTSGILISSPKAQVYYHMDLPGQALWQIHGEKRVYVYPATAPYLTGEQLERIALYEVEVDIPYEAWYDDHAEVFDIGPGDMLHWPLNAPHRVENFDSLNVSMTMEYWSDTIRRANMINVANGILRDKLHVTPKSRAITGPGFVAKAALQAAVRRSGLLKKARKKKRPVTFTLDQNHLGQVIDLPAAAE